MNSNTDLFFFLLILFVATVLLPLFTFMSEKLNALQRQTYKTNRVHWGGKLQAKLKSTESDMCVWFASNDSSFGSKK